MATVDQSDTHDEVIAEVRQIKESLAEECNFDVAEIIFKARQQQELEEQA